MTAKQLSKRAVPKARFGTGTAVAILVLVAGMAHPATSLADAASTMQNELQAAGVPGVSVTVATPAPASAADLESFEVGPLDPSLSVTPENLISPDPTAPLPVASVSFGTATRTPLPGLIVPLGGVVPAVEDAQSVIWRAEVMSALKHAIADGADLAGVAMHRVGESESDVWMARPPQSTFPAVRLQAVTPASEVESDIEADLPPWAVSAGVQITEVAGERRARLSLAMSTDQFIVTEGQELAAYMIQKQRELNQTGAGIGGVSVVLADSAGSPLFVYAGDATFGQNFYWSSPLVSAFVGRVAMGSNAGPVEQATAAAEGKVEEVQTNPPLP